MSIIPSSRGSSSGIKLSLAKFDDSNLIGSATHPGGKAVSVVSPANVREFDEVVLNIRCMDNFGNAGPWPGFGGLWSFAQVLQVQAMYSNMVDYVEDPPVPGQPSEHWSPLLIEDVVSPFTGSVDVAKYSISLKNLEVGATGTLFPGPTPPSRPAVPVSFNLRIPTTMAEWICFIVNTDITGTDTTGAIADYVSPVVDFKLYRGVAL